MEWQGNACCDGSSTDYRDLMMDEYLGIKGGKAGSSHGHMDAGSFVYDA